MTQKAFTYDIAGREWIQRPLVLGQWQQLMEILKGLSINFGGGIPQIVAAIGTRLPLALAVVLIETDGDLKRRFGLRYITNADGLQVPEWYQNHEVMLDIANEIHAGIDAETAMRVIDDFLSCNPASSILDRLTGVMAAALPLMSALPKASMPSSPSSPEETSPAATVSSGDSPQNSASPTFDSASES